jgi:2',3'-cyclic-nucleotide 2'-phosphodiesterase
MRVLFIGDVFGRPGREAITTLLPALRAELGIKVVVANCENAAGGKGLTPTIADALFAAGVDVMTGGNHIWHQKNIEPYLADQPRLVRPANYPNAPGFGSCLFDCGGGVQLGVIQIEGRVFMRNLDCPFRAAEAELDRMRRPRCALLDMHCEATSEKQALAWHFDGRLSAAIGTHTHVQTADERILPGGTALLTDAGMTGPYASVIGAQPQIAIEGFLTHRYRHLEVATGDVRLCGAWIDIDPATGRATAIERVQRALPATRS